jgi:'Cold-shock' DNA-binding domain
MRRLAGSRHLIETTRRRGLQALAEGAKVEYEVEEGPKGPQARDVSVVHFGLNARSSVSLVDALLPGDSLATGGLTRNTRTRLALGHVV